MKKELSKKDFIDYLLELRRQIENNVINHYKKELEVNDSYEGDEEGLRLEAKIFSFWLLTISIPVDKNFLDLLHDTYCEYTGITGKDKNIVYKELQKRYKSYYDSFNFDQEQERETFWPSIGGVMVEFIKRQNKNFSFKEDFPHIVGFHERTTSYILFGESLKFFMEEIDRIREEFDIDQYLDLNNR